MLFLLEYLYLCKFSWVLATLHLLFSVSLPSPLSHWHCFFLQTNREMNEIRDELNQKIAEVRRLQMEFNKRETAEADDDIAEGLKRVIASLEKENYDLTVST